LLVNHTGYLLPTFQSTASHKISATMILDRPKVMPHKPTQVEVLPEKLSVNVGNNRVDMCTILLTEAEVGL